MARGSHLLYLKRSHFYEASKTVSFALPPRLAAYSADILIHAQHGLML